MILSNPRSADGAVDATTHRMRARTNRAGAEMSPPWTRPNQANAAVVTNRALMPEALGSFARWSLLPAPNQ